MGSYLEPGYLKFFSYYLRLQNKKAPPTVEKHADQIMWPVQEFCFDQLDRWIS